VAPGHSPALSYKYRRARDQRVCPGIYIAQAHAECEELELRSLCARLGQDRAADVILTNSASVNPCNCSDRQINKSWDDLISAQWLLKFQQKICGI
jgi:hypothetical protein